MNSVSSLYIVLIENFLLSRQDLKGGVESQLRIPPYFTLIALGTVNCIELLTKSEKQLTILELFDIFSIYCNVTTCLLMLSIEITQGLLSMNIECCFIMEALSHGLQNNVVMQQTRLHQQLITFNQNDCFVIKMLCKRQV